MKSRHSKDRPAHAMKKSGHVFHGHVFHGRATLQGSKDTRQKLSGYFSYDSGSLMIQPSVQHTSCRLGQYPSAPTTGIDKTEGGKRPPRELLLKGSTSQNTATWGSRHILLQQKPYTQPLSLHTWLMPMFSHARAYPGLLAIARRYAGRAASLCRLLAKVAPSYLKKIRSNTTRWARARTKFES